MALIRSETLLDALRTQQHLPYAHFSVRRLAGLPEVLRVFELGAGDAVILATDGHPIYVSVLDGIIECRAGQGPALSIGRATTQLITSRDSQMSLHTAGGALICVAEAEAIDEMMSFESMIDAASGSDRLSLEALERAHRSPAFRRVPLECVEAAFRRMGRITVPANTEIIQQGAPGDLFYVITQGKAEVWQTGLYDDAPQKVAELGPGEVFGEEALVTGGTRSATIRSVTNVELLTLGKEDYQALISQQLVDEVDPPVAKSMLAAGYRLLDVRYPEENEDESIPASELIPLHELRTRMDEVERSTRWLVYCRSGKRSAVATLLLKQRGYQAVSLRGGITAWPYATTSRPELTA
jgi:rhodanese-related sulfurtransferase